MEFNDNNNNQQALKFFNKIINHASSSSSMYENEITIDNVIQSNANSEVDFYNLTSLEGCAKYKSPLLPSELNNFSVDNNNQDNIDKLEKILQCISQSQEQNQYYENFISSDKGKL